MPIKVQSNLPAIKVLESEIFCNAERGCSQAGYPSAENSYSESDADKNRNRNPAFKAARQQSSAG